MSDQMKEFIHPVLNEPVTAIGGSYILTARFRVAFDGNDLLYFTGVGIIDRSCCGVGGCAYALVPGFVAEWQYTTDDAGRPVSRVRPIESESVRQRITGMIQREHAVQQVTFL